MSTNLHVCLYAFNHDTGKFDINMSETYGSDWMPLDYMNEVNAQDVVYERQTYSLFSDYPTPRKFHKEEYQWGRYRNPAWRARAARWIRCGTYEALPYGDLEPIEDHFAHLLYEDGARIVGFYQSVDHGELERVTKMKIGRYFNRYYPHLTTEQVKNLVSEIDKANDFKVASTADEIEKVYKCGPRSCMSYETLQYDTNGIHPVRAYGDSDLKVAYLSTMKINSHNFHASSRAVIWPEKKQYVRIYGDDLRMRRALEAQGYTQGDLEGAKIPAIEVENFRYVMPYLDGVCTMRFSEDRSHFILDNSGMITGSSTSGTTNKTAFECYLTGTHSIDVEHIECYDSGHTYRLDAVEGLVYRCEGINQWFELSLTPQVVRPDGSIWSKVAYDRYIIKCSRTGKEIHSYECVHDREGNRISAEYAQRNMTQDPYYGYWVDRVEVAA